VLHKLGRSRGVLHAAVISEDADGAPHVNQSGRSELDQLSLLASSKYMLRAADLALEYRRDGPARLMTFDDEAGETRTFLWRVEHCVLVVCVLLAKQKERNRFVFEECRQAKSLIEQLLRQSNALRRPGMFKR